MVVISVGDLAKFTKAMQTVKPKIVFFTEVKTQQESYVSYYFPYEGSTILFSIKEKIDHLREEFKEYVFIESESADFEPIEDIYG